MAGEARGGVARGYNYGCSCTHESDARRAYRVHGEEKGARWERCVLKVQRLHLLHCGRASYSRCRRRFDSSATFTT